MKEGSCGWMQSLWFFFGSIPVKSHGTGVLWEYVHTEVFLLQIAPENFTLRHLIIRIMVFQAKFIFYFSLNWIFLISVLVSTVVYCAIFLFIFSELKKKVHYLGLFLFASSLQTHQPTSPTHPYLWKTMNYLDDIPG